VASSVVGSARVSPAVPYFRKDFQIDKVIRSAQLVATACGIYECEINGQRVGNEVFSPGWTDYTKRIQYQIFDVTSFLKKGENALGAILGDGWYCGFVGGRERQIYGEKPSLLAQLDITFEDGETVSIGTDSTWKTKTGPILQSDFLMGEIYDARLELGPWSQPGYDQNDWPPVVAMPAPNAQLVSQMGPPGRCMEELPASLVSATKTWQRKFQLFDFKQNFTGRIRITVKASCGATFQFRFGESVHADGSIYTDNLCGAQAMDFYTCKGDGTEVWEPRFTFHGFRYVEVSASSMIGEFTIEVVGRALYSDIKSTGTFSCSNPLLNQLQSNILWGQKSNFLEVPMDCPQRDERLGWTGDAQVFVRTACFNRDVRDFFRKWMQDIRDSQFPHGGIPPVSPNADFFPLEDGGPAWSDATIICPWTVYLVYEDREILEAHYESMHRFMEFIAQHRCLGRIRSHPDVDSWGGFGDWLALDAPGKLEGATPRDLIATAFYAYDAEIMSRIATILNRKDDAEKYRVLHEEICEAFRDRFITSEGKVTSETQTAYILALHFQLMSKDLISAAAHELVRNIQKRDYHLSTGFVGTPYILEVLENTGHLDEAYKLLEQETFPSWLFSVKNGATTIWERWDGWTPEKGFQDKRMNSFNHYAYGAVGAWMYRTVGGLELDPADAGYRSIIFRPRPGGSIKWAETKLQSIRGEVAIRWELKGNVMDVDLVVPENSRATFNAPSGYIVDDALQFEAGRHRIVLKKQ
ncbi:MAG: family 78 glycoside hydrolase catalytic domain, partial [Chthoniobacterales bacterium]